MRNFSVCYYYESINTIGNRGESSDEVGHLAQSAHIKEQSVTHSLYAAAAAAAAAIDGDLPSSSSSSFHL